MRGISKTGGTGIKRSGYFALMKRLYEKMGRDNGYVPGWTTHTEVLLYEETGDSRYVELLAGDMREQLSRYKTDGIVEKGLKRTGFKIPHRVAASAGVLLNHDSFPEEDKETLRSFIGELLSHAEYERGAMNRAMGFMAAITPLRKLYGAHPEDEDFDEVERLLGNDWTHNCEPEERAYGYEALTYLYLIDWIENGGHQEWYELPAMKRGFENMLYSRAGNGRCAAFCDWRPWEPCWGLYAAIFEKAAAAYQDGRFKFMAERLVEGWEAELAEDIHQHPHDLMGLSFAFRWCDDAVEPEVPSDSKAVITRNSGVVDRLVLRSGWEKDDLFATISLSDREEHGHNDPLAISGLQAEGILLDDNGRETYNDYCHNLPYTCDDPEDFPEAKYREKPGVWQTLRLDFRSVRHYGHFHNDYSMPVKRKHPVGNDLPEMYNYNPQEEWVLFIKWLGIGSYTFSVKEIRLVSDSGIKKLTDFQSEPDPWQGLSAVEGSIGRFDLDFTSLIDEIPEDLGKLPPIFTGRRFNYPLDLENDEYDALEIDYMIEGNLPEEDFHLICIGGSGGFPRQWYTFELPQYGAEVAHYHETDEYCHAVCRTAGRSRTARTLERRREVLFLKNRYVWVKDSVRYHDGEPFSAGPLWQIKKILSKGENWIVAQTEQKLLIYFLPKAVTVVDVAEWENAELDIRGSRYNRYTYYQRLTTSSSEAAYFDTLLIPLKADDDPEGIVSSIVVSQREGGATIVEMGGDRLELDPGSSESGVRVHLEQP